MKETYIQVGSNTKRAISSFDFTVKSVAIPTYPALKETGGTFFVAYTFPVKMVYYGTARTFKTKLDILVAYLGLGEFSLFDVYQNKGVRCRYAGYEEDGKYWQRDGIEVFEFVLNFKVNNPTTYGLGMPLGTISETAPCKTKAYWSNGNSETFLSGASISKNLSVLDSFVILEPQDEGYLRIK